MSCGAVALSLVHSMVNRRLSCRRQPIEAGGWAGGQRSCCRLRCLLLPARPPLSDRPTTAGRDVGPGMSARRSGSLRPSRRGTASPVVHQGVRPTDRREGVHRCVYIWIFGRDLLLPWELAGACSAGRVVHAGGAAGDAEAGRRWCRNRGSGRHVRRASDP